VKAVIEDEEILSNSWFLLSSGLRNKVFKKEEEIYVLRDMLRSAT